MLLFCLLSWAAVFISSAAAWPTYSIDASCTEWDPDFHEVINEMRAMAERVIFKTYWSTHDPSYDPDWQRVFQFLMRTNIHDKTNYGTPPWYQHEWGYNEETDSKPASQHVVDTFSRLAYFWDEVDPMKGHADVRIYCDNMEHWEERVNPQTGEITWVDHDNLVTADSHCDEVDDYARTTVQTFWGDIPGQHQDNDPNPHRAVITLCDKAFTDLKRTFRDDVPPSIKLDANPNLLKHLNYLSTTLLHEWLHTSRFHFDDHDFDEEASLPESDDDEEENPPAQDQTSAGFDYIVQKPNTVEKAIKDCETYAYLGMLALVADRRPILQNGQGPSLHGGYTLRRDILDLPRDGQELRNADVLRGYGDVLGSIFGPY